MMNTSAHDATHTLDGHDPREVLAAVSSAFNEVPEQSAIALACGPDGSVTAIARVEFRDDGIELVVRSICQVIATFSLQGVTGVVLIVIGDIDPGVSPTVKPSAKSHPVSKLFIAKLAEWIMAEVSDALLACPITAYTFSGSRASFTETWAGSESTWVDSPLRNIHESTYALREIAAGRDMSLLGGDQHFTNEAAIEALSSRWGKSIGGGPCAGSGEHDIVEPMSVVARCFDAMMTSGAGRPGWLALADESARMTNCDVFDELVRAASSVAGRDAFLVAIFKRLNPGLSTPDDVMASLIYDPGSTPCGCISPGGELYFCSRLAVAVMDSLPAIPTDPQAKQGLMNLVSIHALIAWWAGRFREASRAARAVLDWDPQHRLAHYVSSAANDPVLPEWMHDLQVNPAVSGGGFCTA